MRVPRSTNTPPVPRRGTRRVRPAHAEVPSPELGSSLAHLRSIVTRHVGERRAGGVPLEQVLAEVSGLLASAEHLEGSPDELGVLLGQVRRWSLDAYFDEPELRNAPRFY